MPATNATVTVVYSNLPAPVITNYSIIGGTNLSLAAQAYPNLAWVLQSSTDLFNWTDIVTNTSASNQVLQTGAPLNPVAMPKQFFRLRSP